MFSGPEVVIGFENKSLINYPKPPSNQFAQANLAEIAILSQGSLKYWPATKKLAKIMKNGAMDSFLKASFIPHHFKAINRTPL